LNGFAQQLVRANGIKINAVTGGSPPDPFAPRVAGDSWAKPLDSVLDMIDAR